MFNCIKSIEEKFIAIVGVWHILYWHFTNKINMSEYEIIFPIHSKLLQELIKTGENLKEVWDEEKIAAANVIYQQVLQIEDFTIIDIDNINNTLMMGEESF